MIVPVDSTPVFLLSSMKFPLFALAFLAATWSLPAQSADKPRLNYRRDVQPLLNRYCFRCHGTKQQAGKVNIAKFAVAPSPLKDRKQWRKVLAKLKDGEMPPEKPLPTKAERKRLIDWIEGATQIDWNRVKHAGHVTIPRLTRDEYNNTLRDLLGVDLQPGRNFSADGEGESGFNNDRDALFISPAQMEKYFAAANSALSTLITMRQGPREQTFEAEKMHMTERNSPPTEWGYILNRGQMTLYDSVTFPHSGTYTFTVRAWSTRGRTGARLRVNDEPKGDIVVPTTEPREYTITCYLKAGTYQMAWNIQAPSKRKPESDAGRKPRNKKSKRRKRGKVVTKSSNAKITAWAKKNTPVFPPGKMESAKVRQLRLRLNSAAYGLQRPYEWLRLLTPRGNRREIARFKGYIADRSPNVDKAKAALAKAMGISLAELNKRWERHNAARLADNKKLLAAVKTIGRSAKKKGKKKRRNNKPGNVAIDWIQIRGPIFEQKLPAVPVVFVAKPGNGLSKRAAAEKIIRRFARRAFRRPVSDAEVARYLKLFDRADQRGDAFLPAVKLPLTAVLVSPNFLFRTELGPQSKEEFQLNDYQLASRLSYFLWMSMPDEELFQLAAKHKLPEPAVMKAQVLRMLKDPKSRAFSRTFAEQWLGIGALGKTVGPDGKKFPSYTPALQRAMIDEAALFVDLMFREDRSLLELIDSRETFLNETLARHYGVAGVKGQQMRRVKLTDGNRGGVLAMAGVLTVTSLPLRTSPVVRGKWVLETLLGEKQPDPPPNVPELAKDAGEKQGKTLREIYAQHRRQAACAACHQRMDPIGFGLENFDAIGRWRDKQRGKAIDSSGVLPGGRRFRGPVELKRIVLERKSDFARNLSRKMLSFALGRRLEYFDEPALSRIQQSLEKARFRATALILTVVQSYPFGHQHTRPQPKELR